MEKATSTSSMERKGKHIKWKCILHTEYLNLLALSFSFVFFITLASFDAAMCHVPCSNWSADFKSFQSKEEAEIQIPSQRMLAQLVSHSGGTPQVLSSTLCGSEFHAEGKKNLRWPRVPKHWL